MAFHDYPYTDFHEMNLDWVIAKVKELTLAWAQTSSDWEELRTFVNDYFANLDVQEEINNKMDELVSDGTLSSLIAPYVASGLPAEVANQIAGVVADQIGAVVAAQLPAQVAEKIPAAVAGEAANWLSKHVDPSTGYVVDDTLTIRGAAADAKATGDAFGELKNALSAGAFVGKSFTLLNYQSNENGANGIDLNIKTGESFYIKTNHGTPVIVYADSTTENATQDYHGIATKDIVKIWVYIFNNTGETMTVEYCVAKNPYGADILDHKNIVDNAIFKAELTNNNIYYDNGNINANSEYSATDLIPVTVPVTVKFDANMASGFHSIIMYDVNGNIIDTYFTNAAEKNVKYTISNANVKSIRFQSRNLSYVGNTIDPVIYIYSRNMLHGLIESNKIIFEKTSVSAFTIKIPNESDKYVRYEFTHYYKKWDSLQYLDENGQTQTASNIVSSDYWNNVEVYNDETNEHIAQGHSNFIAKVYGESGYIGDGHGNEVSLSFMLIADGNVIDIDNLPVGHKIKSDTIRMVSKSNVYSCGGFVQYNNQNDSYPKLDTQGNPVINYVHNMVIDYNIGNNIKINNKLYVKQNNLVFDQCFGAMLECNYGDFEYVICNNDEDTSNIVDDNGDVTLVNGSNINLKVNTNQYCNQVNMFGKDFFIRQVMNIDKIQNADKSAVNFLFYNDRLKCYFAPVSTVNRYPSGATPDTFNIGDIISVTDMRNIDI